MIHLVPPSPAPTPPYLLPHEEPHGGGLCGRAGQSRKGLGPVGKSLFPWPIALN
jgi:hypothetical protein